MRKVGLLNSQFDKEQKGKERAGKGHLSSLLNVSGKKNIISNCTCWVCRYLPDEDINDIVSRRSERSGVYYLV